MWQYRLARASEDLNEVISQQDVARSKVIYKMDSKHEDISMIKLKLNWLGYSGIQITKVFGPFLEKRILEFQRDYNLTENGLLDVETIERIDEAFDQIDWSNSKIINIRYLKTMLDTLGFKGIAISDKMGDYTAQKLREFQSIYELPVTGKVNAETINKINELITTPLQLNFRHHDVQYLKSLFNEIGYGPINVTEKFGRRFRRVVRSFQSDNDIPVHGMIDDKTLERLYFHSKNIVKETFVDYDISFDEFEAICQQDYFENAKEDLQMNTLEPKPLLIDREKRFFFFHLIRTNVVTEAILNKFLEDKGILNGRAMSLLEAAKENGINELYLLSVILVRAKEFSEILDPMKTENGEVFNVLGIGKEMSVESYRQYATEAGWTTVDRAITEGARIYKDSLAPYELNSFYTKMLSLENVSKEKKAKIVPGARIKWINNIVHQLYKIHDQLDHYTLHLNAPKFNEK